MQQYFADSFSHDIFCIYVVERYFSEENALALKNGQTEKLGAGDEKKFLPKDLPKDTHEKTPDSLPLSWGLNFIKLLKPFSTQEPFC